MDKLYEALKTIKEHCASQEKTCKGCPLNISTEACNFFDETPEGWDIERFADSQQNEKEE